jgi:N,N-dimethyltransferase/O-methyltransferase
MRPKTTEDMFVLLDAAFTSAALGTALELGLFWLLAEGPLDTAAVAEALDIPAKRCGYWLQLLAEAGLLEQAGGAYAPSTTARTAILDAYSQPTWAFLAREWRERYPVVQDLTRHIREPGSVWAAQGLTPPNYFKRMVEDPDEARRFTRMLYEGHLPYADALADFLDMEGVKRLMDLGGGSGVVSLALLRRHPRLSAVVVDIPHVCVAGRELARQAAPELVADGRITYHAADFERDELPAGFDRILQCDVGPYNEAMFRKIRALLNPGGRLVIVDYFSPTEGVAPRACLCWAFLGSLNNPESGFPTVEEVQAPLERAGFRLLSQSALPPKGAVRWSHDWTVIEAAQ